MANANETDFRETVRKLKKVSNADGFDFVESFVKGLPLDEHQFVLSVLDDLEGLESDVTTTEKLRTLAALWAAYKADKLLENKQMKKLSENEVRFLDVIRKRESAALNRFSDFREEATTDTSLSDIKDKFETQENMSVPEQKKINPDNGSE